MKGKFYAWCTFFFLSYCRGLSSKNMIYWGTYSNIVISFYIFERNLKLIEGTLPRNTFDFVYCPATPSWADHFLWHGLDVKHRFVLFTGLVQLKRFENVTGHSRSTLRSLYLQNNGWSDISDINKMWGENIPSHMFYWKAWSTGLAITDANMWCQKQHMVHWLW